VYDGARGRPFPDRPAFGAWQRNVHFDA
jgi:hypothetical protein